MSDTGAFVYLVDDDVSVREGVARLVRSAGLMAKRFSSGDGFLAALRPKLPSCWVLDMALLAIGRGLSRLRVYQIAREFDARLEGRLDERLRVARELHDTMLQRFQASLAQMQAARNLFSRRHQATQNLERAINMAAEAIAEGRSAIQGLRCQAADRGDMEKLLTETRQELVRSQELSEHSVRFRVVVEGKRQQLKSIVQEEIYQIARELLRNASGTHRQVRWKLRFGSVAADPDIALQGQPAFVLFCVWSMIVDEENCLGHGILLRCSLPGLFRLDGDATVMPGKPPIVIS